MARRRATSPASPGSRLAGDVDDDFTGSNRSSHDVRGANDGVGALVLVESPYEQHTERPRRRRLTWYEPGDVNAIRNAPHVIARDPDRLYREGLAGALEHM